MTAAIDTIKQNIAKIKDLLNTNLFQIMRWGKFKGWCVESWLGAFIHSTFGWLSMVLLVSLGAPFCYDLLKAVIGVKNQFKENKSSR